MMPVYVKNLVVMYPGGEFEPNDSCAPRCDECKKSVDAVVETDCDAHLCRACLIGLLRKLDDAIKTEQQSGYTRVRIVVSVDSAGNFNAGGWRFDGEEGKHVEETVTDWHQEPVGNIAVHYVEAIVPVPISITVQGVVEDDS